MSPEVISALLTGLAGIITAIAGFYTVRRKNTDADTSANFRELLSLRKENENLRRTILLFTRWTHRMSLAAEQDGFTLPGQPPELRELLSGNDANSGPISIKKSTE